MHPIQSRDSVVYFNEESYTQLNQYLEKANHSQLFILVDSNTHQFCLSYFMSKIEKAYAIEVIEIEAGEIHKNIETCTGVWNALAELGADRNSLLLNLGGGVITDLGGFIACTYKRGIKYINIPTTLLAMVDASVGGKTGVDLGNLKNMVGVISESEMVLVDSEYLATLPAEQMRSGFAEILKHGLISDKDYWNQLKDLAALKLSDLDGIIHRSVEIKNDIVKVDPFEKNIRKHLNFGHTLGHAIESYYLTHPEKPLLLHGEAIAIGMIMETYISQHLFEVNSEELKEVSKVILHTFPKVNLDGGEYSAIADLMKYDKKNEGGTILFSLLNQIGKAVHNCEVKESLVKEAYHYYLSL